MEGDFDLSPWHACALYWYAYPVRSRSVRVNYGWLLDLILLFGGLLVTIFKISMCCMLLIICLLESSTLSNMDADGRSLVNL